MRAQLEPGVAVICISATRLRHILPLPVSEGVCAVFGARDPFKPSGQQLLASGLVTVEVPDAGHEVYRDPGAWRDSRFHSPTSLISGSLGRFYNSTMMPNQNQGCGKLTQTRAHVVFVYSDAAYHFEPTGKSVRAPHR
nr:hypothetical protein [Ralstonia solanacearum]